MTTSHAINRPALQDRSRRRAWMAKDQRDAAGDLVLHWLGWSLAESGDGQTCVF